MARTSSSAEEILGCHILSFVWNEAESSAFRCIKAVQRNQETNMDEEDPGGAEAKDWSGAQGYQGETSRGAEL